MHIRSYLNVHFKREQNRFCQITIPGKTLPSAAVAASTFVPIDWASASFFLQEICFPLALLDDAHDNRESFDSEGVVVLVFESRADVLDSSEVLYIEFDVATGC
jgi:hypothetical protein